MPKNGFTSVEVHGIKVITDKRLPENCILGNGETVREIISIFEGLHKRISALEEIQKLEGSNDL